MYRKVVMIGVAGDSAAGKTTLSKGLVEALGQENVTAICCDHYHKYTRRQRTELGISALAPEGNHIDIMEQHFRLLREGQPVLMPIYNHSTGDFDPPLYIRPKKYVIIEGLLPFHSQMMRLNFDLKVYLDPPEPLRYRWKILRDTTRRGYTEEQVRASLEKRKDLSPRYINPQKKLADIIVRFYPPEDDMAESGSHLNARLVLKPTIPHLDLTDLLEMGSIGAQPALRLNLGRYEGTPADFLEIEGHLAPEKANDLIRIIQSHMVSGDHLDMNLLGCYKSGHDTLRSYPLALTQYLIAYHMFKAGDLIQGMQSDY